jgi:hypothetical protein
MSDLKFRWTAKFEDNSTLPQYSLDDQENLFKKVLDRFSDLTQFTLSHTDKNIVVKVDLLKGIIYVNDEQQALGETELKTNVRLVFFRRHRHDMSGNGQELGHEIFYFIGFQYIDEQGHNVQKVIQLNSEGNILVS